MTAMGDTLHRREPCLEHREATPSDRESKIAMPVTLRAIGPAVSCVCEIGMMPVRLTSPTVGLIPAMPHVDDGHTIDPSVSVPIAAAARFADTAAPDPELDPHGLRSSTYGLRVSPPRPLHPLVE